MNKQVEHTGGEAGKSKHRRSFTLVELLVVIAVIMILLGISLKIMGLVNRKAGVARTTWILEQVKNALGGYYASYGTYPPGDLAANGYSSIEYVSVGLPSAYSSCSNAFGSTGLVFYLTRVDEASKWQHYITNVVPNSGGPTPITNATYTGGLVPAFTNYVQSIVDGWGTKLEYVCSGQDYQNYRLWSCGPNRANNGGVGDDLGVSPGE